VDGDGERLDERAGLVADVVAEREDVLPRHGMRDADALGEGSGTPVGQALRPGRGAEVVAALRAARAVVARHERRRGQPVAHRHAPHLGPGLDDLAGELVAHDLPRRDERAMGVRVQVRAADADGPDRDDHVVRARLGLGDVLDLQILDAPEDGCLHRFDPLPRAPAGRSAC
jgi:hypothetical protein